MVDDQIWPLKDFLDIAALVKDSDLLPHCGCSNHEIRLVLADVFDRLYDLHHLRYKNGRTSIGAPNTGAKFVTWTLLMNLRGPTDCTIPLDHVYGVLGLTDERFRLPPDYSISQTQLLGIILQKHLSFKDEYSRGVWLETYDLLAA